MCLLTQKRHGECSMAPAISWARWDAAGMRDGGRGWGNAAAGLRSVNLAVKHDGVYCKGQIRENLLCVLVPLLFGADVGMGVGEHRGFHICFCSVLTRNTFLRSSMKCEWGGVWGTQDKLLWQKSVIDWSLESIEKEQLLHPSELSCMEGTRAISPGSLEVNPEARWTSVCKN